MACAAFADAPQPPDKSILDLQPRRQTTALEFHAAASGRGSATLVNLNPAVGIWYLLSLNSGGSGHDYHLQSATDEGLELRLDRGGLVLVEAGRTSLCALWADGVGAALESARRSGLPYAPLCGGRLYLRNAVEGSYTRLERVTGFLRDHVWGGEQIISFVRDQFYQDAFLQQAAPAAVQEGMDDPAAPPPARQTNGDPAYIAPGDLDIDLGGAVRSLRIGSWYPVHDMPSVYVSAAQPRAVAPAVLDRYRNRVERLDAVEAEALDYLVAFDLSQFALGFALGTDHPRVGWSEHILDAMRDARLPGPDGIGTTAPLARTGMVSPALNPFVAAAFTGGFKREHGAFRYGELADRNFGSHYGFIEEGVVFSTLQPGLATVYVLSDGTVGMKTWTMEDNALLPDLRYARQNGVALVDDDPVSGTPQPGPLVTQWAAGNWSGSKEEKFRTLRAGLCLLETPGQRFLVYGYFPSATPSAMARVFQAYGCRYAMHLDMNALEHTYLALYSREGSRLLVQHLVHGMEEVDRKGGNQLAPRFIGFPDDRDFFYLLRRGRAP
jgi:hypothetical protein